MPRRSNKSLELELGHEYEANCRRLHEYGPVVLAALRRGGEKTVADEFELRLKRVSEAQRKRDADIVKRFGS